MPKATSRPPRPAVPRQPLYQLKVTLMETDPPIWRRIVVQGESTLRQLDQILQAAMGWTDSHLHTFTAGGVLYANPSQEWEIDVRDEGRVRLHQIAACAGEAFVYEYDLGDSWQHQVLVEQIAPHPAPRTVPVCLDGAGACPPEDSGGVGGYYEKLEVLRDPDHEEYEEIKDWVEAMVDGPFDPEVFDRAAANKRLRACR